MIDIDTETAVISRQVYLDVCALNRPFDDQSQMRIRLETDAVLLILSHVRAQTIRMVVSPVHLKEVSANPDLSRREHMLALLQMFGAAVTLDLLQVRRHTEALLQYGIGVADAARVAFAELSGSDFITVDDRLLRRLQHIDVRVWCGAPTAYCDKEDLR